MEGKLNNQLTTLQVDWNLLFGSMIMFVFVVGMTKIVSRVLLTEHHSEGEHLCPLCSRKCYEDRGWWVCPEHGYIEKVPEEQSGQSIHTLTLPPETKAAMLSLCEKARGKKVEYGMELLIRDHVLMPGPTKWGAAERLRIKVTGPMGGLFHTHPDKLRAHPFWEEIHGRRAARTVTWETVEREPKLSDVDILRLLLDDRVVLVGVGTPHRSYIKVATQAEEISPQLRDQLVEIFPFVADLGAPVEGLERHYHEYTIRLDDGAPSYIDVWI